MAPKETEAPQATPEEWLKKFPTADDIVVVEDNTEEIK